MTTPSDHELKVGQRWQEVDKRHPRIVTVEYWDQFESKVAIRGDGGIRMAKLSRFHGKARRVRVHRRRGVKAMEDHKGIAVTCTVCGLRKKPIGRAAPMEMANSLCDTDCPGYYEDPYPGQLWPGESCREYGYCHMEPAR